MKLIIEEEKLNLKKIGDRLYLDVTDFITLEVEASEPQHRPVYDDTQNVVPTQTADEYAKNLKKSKPVKPKSQAPAQTPAQPAQPTKITNFGDLANGDEINIVVLDKESLDIQQDIEKFKAKVISKTDDAIEIVNLEPVDGSVNDSWTITLEDLGVVCEIEK